MVHRRPARPEPRQGRRRHSRHPHERQRRPHRRHVRSRPRRDRLAGIIPLYLDDLWMLWDKNAKTLHDKFIETVVVKAQGSEKIVQNGRLLQTLEPVAPYAAYAPPVSIPTTGAPMPPTDQSRSPSAERSLAEAFPSRALRTYHGRGVPGAPQSDHRAALAHPHRLAYVRAGLRLRERVLLEDVAQQRLVVARADLAVAVPVAPDVVADVSPRSGQGSVWESGFWAGPCAAAPGCRAC